MGGHLLHWGCITQSCSSLQPKPAVLSLPVAWKLQLFLCCLPNSTSLPSSFKEVGAKERQICLICACNPWITHVVTYATSAETCTAFWAWRLFQPAGTRRQLWCSRRGCSLPRSPSAKSGHPQAAPVHVWMRLCPCSLLKTWDFFFFFRL